jgi:signal transduction histidine kinase/ligand-binding sensor domain-containing protein
LLRLKDGEELAITTEDGLAHDYVLCLAEGRAETLWAGTKEGFSRLHSPAADAASEPADAAAKQFEIESFRARDGLSQSTVYTLCEDREGSLWVGTKHGLNQFLDRRTMLYTTREGLPSNEAGPVLQDASGNLWVGTQGAGLGRFDGRRFLVLTSKEGLASDTIFTLADGVEGELWIGTDRGLNCLNVGPRRKSDLAFKNGTTKVYTTHDGLPADTVWCLCRDRRGVLWAGTAAGIAALRGDRFVRPGGAPELLSVSIRALVARRDGSLLAAREDGGLYRCADDQVQPLEETGLAHREFDAFYEDADGLLWIGAVGSGLTLLDDDRFFNFTTKDGLFDDDIFGIVADKQDRLWMACSKGIFFVARADLRKFAAGEIKRLASTPFSPTDALRTIECKGGVQPALCQMRDGRVWFSTTRGMIVIDPNHLQRDIPPTPVLVEEVIVNGKSEQPDQVRRLPPGETNLSFRYAALSFVSPNRITFRHKLEGYDKNWIEAGSRREAFYTNLPPGDYRFRVTGRTMDGTVNELSSPLSFTLEPRFYQNPWFLPLCGAAVGLAVWAAYRLRVRRIREQLQAVVAERSRIARELHDTLMQGFSGVTMEMQALSVRLPPSQERNTLEEIIHDAGICLQEARRSVAGLRSARSGDPGLAGAIAEAARHITETQDVRLKLRLQGDPRELGTDVRYNLLRILQEAVTNAVKHSGAGTIEVILDCTAQTLFLTIKDDGVGFDLAEGNGSQPGHYGVIGMRERATQIGGDLQMKSEPGHGTKVTLSLPLGQTSNHASSAKSPQRFF